MVSMQFMICFILSNPLPINNIGYRKRTNIAENGITKNQRNYTGNTHKWYISIAGHTIFQRSITALKIKKVSAQRQKKRTAAGQTDHPCPKAFQFMFVLTLFFPLYTSGTQYPDFICPQTFFPTYSVLTSRNVFFFLNTAYPCFLLHFFFTASESV